MLLSEIFDIKYGTFSTPINTLPPGNIPLITSGGINNGVVGFFNIQPKYENVISVARTGSVGETFYHNYQCVINSDCMVLTPLFDLSLHQIYWYVLQIRKLKSRFSYARKVTPKRLGDITVNNEIPEWVLQIKLEEITDFSGSVTSNKVDLDVQNWKNFKYEDIFEIKKGKRITNNSMRSGAIPCIRPIDSNNGVHDYIEIQPNHSGNTITVNYNGSVAEAFYQPVEYFALDDVNILYAKFDLNPYIAIFIITLIRKEKYRFNYGRKWHLSRMNDSYIKLPIGKDGAPDWLYMENYIKSLPYSSNL